MAKRTRKCSHMRRRNSFGPRHAFEWPEAERRNIWNPLHPVCGRCGKTIGELLGLFAPTRKARP